MAPGLHVEWVGDEAVVLDIATKELHYLNPTAAVVFALIEEKGYADALSELEGRFKGQAIQGDVESLVGDMVERGLLVDE